MDLGPKSTPESTYDVVIIGAGVVGCAVARRFSLQGAKVLVIEKAADILDGASKGNSGLLHTGFDAPPGSVEQRCIAAGYQEYMEIRGQLNLPVLETGALVVAWTREEESKLDALMDKARVNGVNDIEPLTARQIAAREPHLSKAAIAGFCVPREFVIDPWTAPFAYLLQAMENGASILRNTEVTGGHFDGDHWQLQTSSETIKCRTIINCAGLYGDRLDAALLGKSSFEIRPRKGQFLVFDKLASTLVSSIILPVPSETTKGVVICRTIFGNVLVGPTAEEQESRDDASVDTETLRLLRQKGEEMIPALADCPIVATYAGLRPATEYKDYCIQYTADKNYISVGGIRSTGLSSALGIASYIFEHYTLAGNSHTPIAPSIWPLVPAIAEDGPRDWSKPDNGGVVCHCELVTRREIERALSGPLAAESLSGLKRRTRVTMGRCQGFYCSAQLCEMTAGHFEEPIGLRHVDKT
ncbi:MAG: NAD(P)/FAD-dependent oxidoreductase [Rhodospirillaceae bacterium]|nr:NAD(P)/FAD-dependent oxidoreductase [Rhodospirillaceae bacterium]